MGKNEIQIKDYLNKIANINVIHRIIKYNKSSKTKEENNFVKTPLNNYSTNKKDASSLKYHKRIVKKQFNKKNISSENFFDKRSENESSEFFHLNSSVKVKNSDFFNKNNFNSNTYEHKKRNNYSKTFKIGSKTPMLSQQPKQKYTYIKSKNNKNRSLLENYFNLKKNNTNDKFIENNNIFNDGSESVQSQKNSKSFNNLNILNNFYNLDYSRRSPNNKDIKDKGYINIAQMKLYKDSLNKLIPKQLKQINFK